MMPTMMRYRNMIFTLSGEATLPFSFFGWPVQKYRKSYCCQLGIGIGLHQCPHCMFWFNLLRDG